MGICWWCHWGWPKPIRDIYDKALQQLEGNESPLHYGPAHIVWEDENWDSAQWCLDHFDEFRGDHSEEDLAIVRWSLEELLKVDKKFTLKPDDYDDENPQNYPPPSDWVMVR